MLTINLFRRFPTQILTLDLPSSLSLPLWMLRLCLGDGGLGLWKVKDIYNGQFHWDLALSGTLAGFCLLMIHMHNKDNSGWKAHASQRQGRHFISKVKSRHHSSTWWSAALLQLQWITSISQGGSARVFSRKGLPMALTAFLWPCVQVTGRRWQRSWSSSSLHSVQVTRGIVSFTRGGVGERAFEFYMKADQALVNGWRELKIIKSWKKCNQHLQNPFSCQSTLMCIISFASLDIAIRYVLSCRHYKWENEDLVG